MSRTNNGKIDKMRIFNPLKGEYIASALLRGNEMMEIKSLSKMDFRIKPIPRKKFGFSETSSVESRTHAIFNYPEWLTDRETQNEVLHEHTLYPITAALGRSLTNVIVTPTNWRKLCIDCVIEDTRSFGTAFVHTRNTEASVSVCSVHGSELAKICPTCKIPFSSHSLRKLESCQKKYKIPSYHKNSIRHLYAKFVSDLLNYRGETKQRNVVESLVYASIVVKHKNNHISDAFCQELLRLTLGINTSKPIDWSKSNNTLTTLAFLGSGTADNYLQLTSGSPLTEETIKTHRNIIKNRSFEPYISIRNYL